MQLIQNTAKIYQFPVRERTNSNAVKTDTRVRQDSGTTDAPVIVHGNGWYHDAAIEDSRRPGKH